MQLLKFLGALDVVYKDFVIHIQPHFTGHGGFKFVGDQCSRQALK